MRVLAVCLFLAIAAPAVAQDGPDIVVTAPEVEAAARAFTNAVSAPPSREDQLARFERRVCPGVVGLGRRQAQFIVDRIAQRALDVGLNVGAPGCLANVLVLVTGDAPALARQIAEDQRYLMANYGVQENLNTRGEDALEDFISTDRPVRWWHVSQTETDNGEVLGHTNPYGRMRSPSVQEFRGAEVTRPSTMGFGRLSRPTLQSLRNVVVIVDARRVASVRLDALSDYIAMVALAQTEPGADTAAYDTILNLFSDNPAGEIGMTAWDQAYLEGLYAGRGNALNARWQGNNIARRMRDEIAPEQRD